MKALRALLVACVAALACMSPMSVSQAKAASNHGHQRIYWVYYRTCADSQWVCYGGYYHHHQAVQAVNYFKYQGYDSYYR